MADLWKMGSFLWAGVFALRVDAAPLCARSVAANQIVVEKTLHSAAALGAMTLLFTIHRAIMTSGFTLTRRIYSTDTVISVGVCFVALIWTILVFVSSYLVGDRPCATMGLEQCLSRLAYVPWILIVMSLAWWVWLLDAIWFQGARRTRNSAVGLWMMVVDTGPYGWKQCVTRRFLVILYLVLFGTAGVTSYGALRDRQFTLGILNAVGIALLAADAGGQNKYCKAPHLYQADNLRIPLTTTFNAAMVYVLPSRHYGFDAVHSPKIEYEHRSLDAKIALLFGPLAESGSKWSAFECGFNMRQIVNDHNKNIVRLADEQLINLAKWLYCKSDDRGIAVMRSIRCDRRDGVNLIGRELIMALLHAEYLLFELRERLPPDLNNEWSRLRNAKYSGQGDNIEPAAGFARTGKEGYQDAVSFIYKIFGLSVPDPSALDPEGPPPDRSEALSLEPESINDYVGKLWDMCCKADSTTLGAM